MGEISPPWESIKDIIDEAHMNETVFASLVGLTGKGLQRLKAGEMEIQPLFAKALSSALGSSQQFWLNREIQYRAARNRRDAENIATLERRLKKRDRAVDRLAEENRKLEGQLAEAQEKAENYELVLGLIAAADSVEVNGGKPCHNTRLARKALRGEVFDTSAPKDSAPKTGFQLALEDAKSRMSVVNEAGKRWEDSAPGREGLTIHRQLQGLTDKERMDIFYKFCRYCGSTDPSCQCWNDE